MQEDHKAHGVSSSSSGEMALTSSADQLAPLLQTLPLAFFKLDQEQVVVQVSRFAATLLQQSTAEITGKKLSQLFHREDHKALFNILEQAIPAGGTAQATLLLPRLQQYINVTVAPAPNGLLLYLQATTKPSATEATQPDGEQSFLDVTAFGHIRSFELFFQDDTVYWSDILYKLHGLVPQSEKITLDRLLSFVHPDDRTAFREALQHLRTYQTPIDLKHRLVLENGAVKHVHRQVASLSAEAGASWFAYSRVQDITEQVLAQEQLEASENLLQEAETVGHFGSYEVDLATTTFRFSEGMFSLFGFAPGSFTPSIEFIDSISHPDDVETVKQVLNQAAARAQPYEYWRRIYRKDGQMRYMHSQGKVVTDSDGKAIKLLGIVRDVTEQVLTRQQMKESQDLLQAVFQTVPLGIYVLQAVRDEANQIIDFRYTMTNGVADRLLDIDLIGKTLQSLPPAFVQRENFQLLVRTIETGGPMSFTQYFNEHQQPEWLYTQYNRLHDSVVVSHENITEIKEGELQMQQQKALLQAILDSAQTSIASFSPVYNKDGTIVDMTCQTANHMAEVITGKPLKTLVGSRLQDHFPASATNTMLKYIRKIMKTGMPVLREVAYYRADQEEPGYYMMSLVKQRNSIVQTVLDITERKKAELELKASKELLQAVFDATPFAINLFKPIFKEDGEPEDFEFVLVNQHTFNLINRQNIIETTFKKNIPAVLQASLFKDLKHVMLTGERTDNDTGDATTGWFRTTTYKLGDLLVNTVENITNRKLAQQEIKEKNELLRGVLDAPNVSVALLHAVTEEEGEISDFRIQLLSKSIELWHHRTNMVGKSLLQDWPVINRYMDDFRRVVQTGIPNTLEIHYDADGKNAWLELSLVKYDSGFLLGWEDITERKKQEEEIRNNLAILKQSEEVAGMGSWEYDVVSSEFNWSEGMYRVFAIRQGDRVVPEIYLKHMLEEDQAVAERIVGNIRSDFGAMEETIRVWVDGQLKTLKIKAVAVLDENGKPAKMLGVDLDITEVKRLEEENLQMKLNQQRNLLNAILEVQEIERKRIAEGLHNGVGQLLYGITLYISQLELDGEQRSKDLHKHIEGLLQEAISEVRTISFELTPTILQDFGLEVALQQLCSKLSLSSLDITLGHYDIEPPLDATLQLVIYRIVQELINNAIKHAEASHINIRIKQKNRQLSVCVEDNGKGMSKQEVQLLQGIGLISIKNRLKLLKGHMDIKTSRAMGTKINIILPVSD